MKQCEICGTITTRVNHKTGYEDWYGGRTGNTYCRNCWRLKVRPVRSEKIPCACGCGELIPSISTGGTRKRFKHNHHARAELHYKWKGGKSINTQGYIEIKQKGHPRATKNHDYRVREHILIMEKHIGRHLVDGEIVHHINGNKKDNRIENLQLMDKIEHDRHHMQERLLHKKLET